MATEALVPRLCFLWALLVLLSVGVPASLEEAVLCIFSGLLLVCLAIESG